MKKISAGSYVLGYRMRRRLFRAVPVAIVAVLLGGLTFNMVRPEASAATYNPQTVAYYGNWDIYQNGYFLKDVNKRAAKGLTTLVYSFENIHPDTLKCFEDVHPVSTDDNNPLAGDYGADAWADYQRPMTAAESVDGAADDPAQHLRGNFNQLKKFKQQNPKVKIMLSIGGWTFSKYFSKAAQPANRAAFVSSCVDMYIRGNLPVNVGGDTTNAGGLGVAKGIFDGIDIDWEFPGTPNGHTGNYTSPDDKANYTALLQEFRTQLNQQGLSEGDVNKYRLTAAVGSGGDEVNQIDARAIAPYVNYVGIMSYDMHGAWEQGTSARTNFQAPLKPSASDPDTVHHFTVQESVDRWTQAGMPADKLLVGVPFYWRGWSGVPDIAHGLYQPVGGASPAFSISQSPGVAHYKELLSNGKLVTVYEDPDSGGSPWAFDGSNFWTGDDMKSLSLKGNYIRNKGLAGAMVYSLESDDKSATLLSAINTGLRGGQVTKPPVLSQVTYSGRTAVSATNTALRGEPINMIGGNFLLTRNEFKIPNRDNPIDFALNYSSTSANLASQVGAGWTHNYRITAVPMDDDSGSVVVQNPDGRMDLYTANGSGGYNPPTGINDTLTNNNGQFKVTHKDRSVYNFNADGLIASIVSANGNSLTMSYDSSDMLTAVTDSFNRKLTFTYDDSGMITAVTDPSGRSVTYTYDAFGNLTQVKNQANEITKYAYDVDHHLTKLTDPRGNTTVNNTYDDQGRVVSQTNGLNKTVTLDYSVPGQTTYTDANGGHTVYYYDSNMRLTKVHDAMGGDTTTTYDAAGNVYQTTDPLGHTTTRMYDSRNNLTSVTNAAGGVQTFAYDVQDNVLTHTDELNRTTTYAYDTNGNITQKKDPLNNITKFGYNLNGQLISVTDPLNNLTGFVYDANGNPVTKTDPSNRNTYYGYDSVGRLTAVETHNLHETDFVLDPMDRVTKATDPSGHDTTAQYDADGNKTKVTDANGHATSYEYDANNNLTKTTDPLLKATTYEYDGNDNLVKKTDAKGHITTYAYDLLDRQTQTTDPLNNVSKVTYDAVGNVVTRVDASNRTTAYAYDNLNRLTTITYPDNTTATRTYDAVGNLLTAANTAGTTTYTYDADDHVLTVKDPHNALITYTYNAAGNVSTVKYPDNKTVTYTYTPSNQLSTVVDWNNQSTTYLYDNDAQLATKTLPNSIKATYTYDANGSLSSLNYKKGTAAFTNYAYTRDNVGNIIEEDETKSNGTHVYNDYAYDAADQLTFNDAPADTYNYSYDDVGNMATSSNGTTGTSTYTYNNANQLTSKTNTTRNLTYDPQGNEITDTGKALAYDFDDRLKTFTSGAMTTSYIYDAIGNRVEKNQTGGTGATNYQYVNIGNDNILQAKNMTAGTSQYYLYGLDQISQGDSASTSRQYFITDGMGNVRYLTNNTGGNVTSYAYDAFGKQLSGSGTASAYTFQDEQKDGESSLTYLRARYYDPTIARFTSQDPMSGTVGDLASQNGYNYANNNPINLTDPLGLAAQQQKGLDLTGYDPSGVSQINKGIKNCSWGDVLSGGATFIGALYGVSELRIGAKLGVAGYNIIKTQLADHAGQEFKSSLQLGNDAHKAFYDFVKSLGGEANKTIPGTKLRPDGTIESKQIVQELKPANSRGVKEGTAQLKGYMNAKGYDGQLWLYNQNADGTFNFWLEKTFTNK